MSDIKKVLIISDTHAHNIRIMELMEKINKPDLLIHCGDVESDPKRIEQIAGCPGVIVAGNCDYRPDLKNDEIITIGKNKFWVTHGHRYAVALTYETIVQQAERRGVDVVCYGHTHIPEIKRINNITLINPGSLTYPKQEGGRPSYIMADIDDDGEAHFAINYL